MIAVGARVDSGQGSIIGVTDEPDPHTLPVAEVAQCLPNLLDERLWQRSGFALVRQGHDEVPDARSRRQAFLEAHLANGFDAAHLYPLDVIRRGRLQRPLAELLVSGQVPLNGLSRPGRVDLTGGGVRIGRGDLTGPDGRRQ